MGRVVRQSKPRPARRANIYLPVKHRDMLNAIALLRKVSRSAIIQQAIEAEYRKTIPEA